MSKKDQDQMTAINRNNMNKQNAILALTALLFSFVTSTVEAQKPDKQEVKEWKKKQKAMSAMQFKAMYEEYGQLQKESNNLKKIIASTTKRINSLDQSVNSRTEDLSKINIQIEEAKQKQEEAQAETESKEEAGFGEDFTKGVVYRVEVGAMREKNKHLEQYQIGNFWSTAEDGKKRYTLAHFRDYWEADTFKKHLRSLGISDAYVYAYRDNKLEAISENDQPKETEADQE